jgi:glycerophosphoryl diester phosphodiesterase
LLLSLKEYPFDKQPMICAHRGDTTHGAHENSLDSIREALTSGAEMIETDVQMTSDGILLCHHDEKLPSGKRIWEVSYDEIRRDYDGNEIPTFESLLEVTAGEIYLNIEMKEYSARDPKSFIEPLVALVRKYGMHEYSLYSSFRIDYIRGLPWDAVSTIIHPTSEYLAFFNSRSANPVTPPKRVEDMLPSELLGFSNAITYACMLEELVDAKIADIKMRNIHLSVYTITTTDGYDRARAVGAKAVVTDVPHLLREYRDKDFLAKSQS